MVILFTAYSHDRIRRWLAPEAASCRTRIVLTVLPRALWFLRRVLARSLVKRRSTLLHRESPLRRCSTRNAVSWFWQINYETSKAVKRYILRKGFYYTGLYGRPTYFSVWYLFYWIRLFSLKSTKCTLHFILSVLHWVSEVPIKWNVPPTYSVFCYWYRTGAGRKFLQRIRNRWFLLPGEILARTVLSPVHTVAEKCDCRRFLPVFGDSRHFLRQSHFSATVWAGLYIGNFMPIKNPTFNAKINRFWIISQNTTTMTRAYVHGGPKTAPIFFTITMSTLNHFYRAMLCRERLCVPSVCPSVRLSVTFRYRDHIKVIPQLNNLKHLLTLTPTWAIWWNRSGVRGT